MTFPTLSPEEFFEYGYAQQVNCILLHPLGLSFRLVKKGLGHIMEILDYRNLETGLMYSDEFVKSKKFRDNVERLYAEYALRAEKRIERYGFIVQSELLAHQECEETDV